MRSKPEGPLPRSCVAPRIVVWSRACTSPWKIAAWSHQASVSPLLGRHGAEARAARLWGARFSRPYTRAGAWPNAEGSQGWASYDMPCQHAPLQGQQAQLRHTAGAMVRWAVLSAQATQYTPTGARGRSAPLPCRRSTGPGETEYHPRDHRYIGAGAHCRWAHLPMGWRPLWA